MVLPDAMSPAGGTPGPARQAGPTRLVRPISSSRMTRPRLAHFDRRPLGGGAFARDSEGLLPGRNVKEKETADDLLGLRERPVHHARFAVADFDPCRLAVGL